MYDAPINVVSTMGDFLREIDEKTGEEVYKAVFSVGVNVDKEELLRALQYDRDQYEKGYRDATERIVRCNICRFGTQGSNEVGTCVMCKLFGDCMDEYDFCSRGERSDSDRD